MATLTVNYGSETAVTATNLNSLANNAAKVIGGAAVDNSSTKAVDFQLYVEVTLGAASVSATGTLELYLIESSESTTLDFTDGIDPTSSSDISSSLKNAKRLAVFNANANAQVIKAVVNLSSHPGVRNAPKYWAPVIYNKSGAALHASAHEMTQTAIKYDVA
jgi:hypothetical protein